MHDLYKNDPNFKLNKIIFYLLNLYIFPIIIFYFINKIIIKMQYNNNVIYF